MEKYIIMQSVNNSDWDCSEFALLEVSLEFLQKMKEGIDWLKSVKDRADEIVVISDDVTHFASREDLPQRILDVVEDKESHEIITSLIELSDEEYEALTCPEQTIKYGRRHYRSDDVLFSAFGKHTDEEFWCTLHYSHVENFIKELEKFENEVAQ